MHQDDRTLLRHLHGELSVSERRALEARLDREPALARRADELAGLWGSLEGPPMPAHDRELTRQVVAVARSRAEQGLPAPAWARAGAVATLLLGTWLGFQLAPGANLDASSPVVATLAETDLTEVDFTEFDFDVARMPLGDLSEGELTFEDLTLEEALTAIPNLAESFWLDDTVESP